MICPKCGFKNPELRSECMKCGVIFAKYHERKKRVQEMDVSSVEESGTGKNTHEPGMRESLKELLFYVKPDINVFYFAGRGIVFLAIVIWGIKFISTPLEGNYTGRSFMHMINLPFHEAGHVLFRPFGQFMMMLGGSLAQVIVPFTCLIAFLVKTRDTFAASVTAWWMGESLMDLAPYIDDARKLTMMLLGGVTGRDVEDYHDWEFILRKLGLLQHEHAIAVSVNLFGIFIMICAVVWGGMLLFKQFRNLDVTY